MDEFEYVVCAECGESMIAAKHGGDIRWTHEGRQATDDEPGLCARCWREHAAEPPSSISSRT